MINKHLIQRSEAEQGIGRNAQNEEAQFVALFAKCCGLTIQHELFKVKFPLFRNLLRQASFNLKLGGS
jgi:hypothetical protein